MVDIKMKQRVFVFAWTEFHNLSNHQQETIQTAGECFLPHGQKSHKSSRLMQYFRKKSEQQSKLNGENVHFISNFTAAAYFLQFDFCKNIEPHVKVVNL